MSYNECQARIGILKSVNNIRGKPTGYYYGKYL